MAVDIMVYQGADPAQVATRIEGLGAAVTARTPISPVWEIITIEAAAEIFALAARIPGVYSIQPQPTDGGLRGEMSNQVCVNNVDGSNLAFPGYQAWLSGVGLSGAGITMANVDSGVQETHPDLVSRFIPCTGTTCSSTSSSHGTHTAGIMAGTSNSGTTDSYGFLRAQGFEPGPDFGVAPSTLRHWGRAGGLAS